MMIIRNNGSADSSPSPGNDRRRPAGMFEIRDQLSAVAEHLGLAEVDLRGADDEE